MVTIRLSQNGRTKQKTYRVVILDSHDKRDGECVECIGHYDPRKKAEALVINEDAAYKWLKLGAVPSETVKSMLKKLGIWKKWNLMAAGKDVAGVALEPKVEKKKRAKKRKQVAAA